MKNEFKRAMSLLSALFYSSPEPLTQEERTREDVASLDETLALVMLLTSDEQEKSDAEQDYDPEVLRAAARRLSKLTKTCSHKKQTDDTEAPSPAH
ncbi:MAG: hypothetical protein GKS00_10495 [Alphaproteobacteria bacterium]|nr:hypothetical protein [Alphaproteobacteria bacterium]